LPIYVIFLAKEIATMATMNVSLPDPMKAWVEAQTQDGRYSNASDYVRDLIRRDQDRQQAIVELQQLVDEGLASGPAGQLDFEAFLARKRDQNARTDGR
jgi:antitoxin ParD1/3/4